jgi:hypothetical protein
MNPIKALFATVLLAAATFGTGCGDSDTPGVSGQISPVTPPCTSSPMTERQTLTDPTTAKMTMI